MDEETVKLIRLLLARLERISADSVWAHRASGVKGTLLNVLEEAEHGDSISADRVDAILALGFKILKKAAE